MQGHLLPEPTPPGAYIPPFCGILPDVCKENMARRLARRRVVKFGIGNIDEIPLATPPPWVHHCNLQFMAEPSLDGPQVTQGPPMAI
jgi:hypothetical protein